MKIVLIFFTRRKSKVCPLRLFLRVHHLPSWGGQMASLEDKFPVKVNRHRQWREEWPPASRHDFQKIHLSTEVFGSSGRWCISWHHSWGGLERLVPSIFDQSHNRHAFNFHERRQGHPPAHGLDTTKEQDQIHRQHQSQCRCCSTHVFFHRGRYASICWQQNTTGQIKRWKSVVFYATHPSSCSGQHGGL